VAVIKCAPPRAAYIHVPFCRHHCGYCNFTVVAGRDDLINDYLRAVAVELSWLETPRPVDTLFIGGGTPTHLAIPQLTQLCQLVQQWFPLEAGGEWSVEVNPGDLTDEKAALLADAGVTRVSLGVQSFQDGKLQILERDHRRPQIEEAVRRAQRHFAVVAIDLIFAAPEEGLAQGQEDLESALSLDVQHMSVYGLTFEKGTRFWARRQRGQLAQANEETEREMYLLAMNKLIQQGWQHYEISNFALPGFRCRHNEVYWKGGSYFAAGPGASRHVDGCRETNHRSTSTYLKRVLTGQSPVAESERLSAEERAREQLVFGLRMLEGVGRAEFAEETGFQVDDLVGPQLARFAEMELIQDRGDNVRLTRAGLLVSDSLWPEMI
jgi:oxygen-independent coproporphyrinogen-3 oxidase